MRRIITKAAATTGMTTALLSGMAGLASAEGTDTETAGHDNEYGYLGELDQVLGRAVKPVGKVVRAPATTGSDAEKCVSGSSPGPLANLLGTALPPPLNGICQHLVNFGLANHFEHGLFDR